MSTTPPTCSARFVFCLLAIFALTGFESPTDTAPLAISEVRATVTKVVACQPSKAGASANVTTSPTQCTLAEPALGAVPISGAVTLPSGGANASYDDEGFQVSDRTGGIFVQTGATNLGL